MILRMVLAFTAISSYATPCPGELAAAIESIAAFDLNELQRPTEISSARYALRESLDQKIVDVARLSGLPEDAIRDRILRAKQILFFAPRAARERFAEGARRELQPLEMPIFFPERTIDGANAGPVVFSTDSRTLFWGDRDSISMLRLDRNESLRTLEGHADHVLDLAVSGDGRTLVSGSYDLAYRIWDLTEDVPPRVIEGHAAPVVTVAVNRTADLVISGSFDKTLGIWDAARGELQRFEQRESIESVALSPNGTMLATGNRGGGIQYWHVSKDKDGFWTVKRIPELDVALRTKSVIRSLQFSPDGKKLLSASSDGVVRLWDIVQSTQVEVLREESGGPPWAAFSPDGKYIARTQVGGPTLSEVRTGLRVQDLLSDPPVTDRITFSPDGKRIAGRFLDGIQLWNVDPLELEK